jgi:adenine deaminase
MATLNPATYHRLWRLGGIAPGYQADLVVLEDLVDFGVRLVLKRGAEPSFPRLAAPDWVRGTMNAAPVSADSFRVPAINQPMQVIGVVSMQLLTTAERVEPSVRDGETVADPARDLVKIAVVERHHASGRVGIAFATNVGLRRGAYASTVAHDAHNIVVLGVDDQDMAVCVRRLGELGGGIVVAEGGRVLDELPLPVAGLMSDQPLQAVYGRLRALEARLREMGVAGEAPFMTLSFLALSVIPELKITDRGLVDVGRFRIVPLAAG